MPARPCSHRCAADRAHTKSGVCTERRGRTAARLLRLAKAGGSGGGGVFIANLRNSPTMHFDFLYQIITMGQTVSSPPPLPRAPAPLAAPYDAAAVRNLSGLFSDTSLFRVANSPLEGRGLFLTRAIERGERAGMHFIEIRGVRGGRAPVARPMVRFFPRACNFHMRLRQTLTDQALLSCFGRATNHQCNASCELESEIMSPERKRGAAQGLGLGSAYRDEHVTFRAFYFVARRHLAAGAELTVNYMRTPGYIHKPAALVERCRRRGPRGQHAHSW